MPIYEYLCPKCSSRREAYVPLRLSRFRRTTPCGCGAKMERALSVPTVVTWKEDRAFPNVSKEGDGSKTFETRRHYEDHLKRNHLGELGVHAKIKTPHTAKVYRNGAWDS